MSRRRGAIALAVLAVVGVVQAPIDSANLAGEDRVAQGRQTSIRLGRTMADGTTRVETLLLDTYLAQVLAGEGQPAAAAAAQQALAITARTFAIANRNRHRREGFDLCDTTHCQVVRAATAVTRRAADATSGRMLLHQGKPAFVFYSAWCGGHSELASQVWPGAIDYASETPTEDDACAGESGWTSEIKASDLERALRAAGLRGSTLRNLRIASRNRSNRVARIRVEGFNPPEISGHEFRMAIGRIVGWQALKSTAFDVERTSGGYRFRGRGFGHGVGLCVIGAGHRASRGATADQILRFYFPGLSVGVAPLRLDGRRARRPSRSGQALHRDHVSGSRSHRTCRAGSIRHRAGASQCGRRGAPGAAVADSAQPRRGHQGHRRDRAGTLASDRASHRREFRARHGAAVVGGRRHRGAGD